MKNNRSVAVIMSVYSSDKISYFKDAVDSILNQSYSCTLFIFRDGTVSDEIQAYLDELEKHDAVTIYQSDLNVGLAKGLNFLIDKIVGLGFNYIARMDSDDIAFPQRIEKQVDFLEKNPSIGICGTSCMEFGATYALAEKHLPTTHEELVDFSITRCPFIHPTIVFRCSVFIDNEIRYPQNTHLTEDMALWFEFLQLGVKFSNINDVLLKYRMNESTVYRRKGMDKAISEFKLRFRYMFSLNKVTIRNFLLICARLFFHLLPISVIKFAYKKGR